MENNGENFVSYNEDEQKENKMDKGSNKGDGYNMACEVAIMKMGRSLGQKISKQN